MQQWWKKGEEINIWIYFLERILFLSFTPSLLMQLSCFGLSMTQSPFKLSEKGLIYVSICQIGTYIHEINSTHFMNGKNTKLKEFDSLYFVPTDNFLFPNIFSSIFIKKGQIQQNFAQPYILWENTTKCKLEIIICRLYCKVSPLIGFMSL